ncbi:MAG: aminotransferase class III-fold pyridoxal phosphate-dependent enzyme [Solirubrobacterales bacterium]
MSAVATGADPAAVFESVRSHFSGGAALGAKMAGLDAVEVGADGAVVRLSDGREALDLGSYGVTLLGHRHPAVIAAVEDQLGRMPAATRTLANPATAAMAARVAAAVDPRLSRVWLGSDGADAVEVALKLARRASGRPRVLAVEGGFHGKTLGALALTWNPQFRTGLDGHLGGVSHVARDDADTVRREVARGDVAALLFEPVQGESGVRELDRRTLERWAADARAGGAFVISDEIQSGLRRCGPVSLAVELDLEPDGVLLGKALGGGVMPLSALVASERLYAPLAKDPTWHTATFGGHPLACAAGLAALDAVDEHAPAAEDLATRFDRHLAELRDRHGDVLAEVGGRGLMRGLVLRSPGAAGSLLVELAQRGVLVSPCLGARRTVRLLPPMVMTPDQLDRAMEICDEALGAAAAFAEEGESDELR